MLYGGTLLKGTQIASSDWKKAWDTCKKKNKKSPAKSCLDALLGLDRVPSSILIIPFALVQLLLYLLASTS